MYIGHYPASYAIVYFTVLLRAINPLAREWVY
jgi:hypothetical protein